MKYYLIAGEASGDLHASCLIQALLRQDPQAEFRCYGGDLMQAAGATLVCHYRHLAYMGFIPVLMHARTILRGIRQCKEDIRLWQPDALILVDYPGFNMRIAKYVKAHTSIPVFYYISPKIWAWKEYRIRDIRRDVDRLLSILPFEVAYFEQKHHYPIRYVGNPTRSEVSRYQATHPRDFQTFTRTNGLDERPVIALLAGSRRQEIRDNFSRMIQAAAPLSDRYQLVLAAAPGIDDAYYSQWLGDVPVRVLRDQTYAILQHSTAALVTSGTATLETALFQVPQVVCYYIRAGRLVSWARRHFLHVPYISLVNLIAGRQVVPELVADGMTVQDVRTHLLSLLPGGEARTLQLEGYQEMANLLGDTEAPELAAQEILSYI